MTLNGQNEHAFTGNQKVIRYGCNGRLAYVSSINLLVNVSFRLRTIGANLATVVASSS